MLTVLVARRISVPITAVYCRVYWPAVPEMPRPVPAKSASPATAVADVLPTKLPFRTVTVTDAVELVRLPSASLMAIFGMVLNGWVLGLPDAARMTASCAGAPGVIANRLEFPPKATSAVLEKVAALTRKR